MQTHSMCATECEPVSACALAHDLSARPPQPLHPCLTPPRLWSGEWALARLSVWALLPVLLGFAALLKPAVVLAQAWPTKQAIKLVAVFPPGGSVDQVARILAQPLQTQLGQSVIVDNRGGASGTLGTA